MKSKLRIYLIYYLFIYLFFLLSHSSCLTIAIIINKIFLNVYIRIIIDWINTKYENYIYSFKLKYMFNWHFFNQSIILGKIKIALSGPMTSSYFAGALSNLNGPQVTRTPIACFEYIKSFIEYSDAFQQNCFAKGHI